MLVTRGWGGIRLAAFLRFAASRTNVLMHPGRPASECRVGFREKFVPGTLLVKYQGQEKFLQSLALCNGELVQLNPHLIST